jgi:heparan-alpha-glucosaminide N-acetyltransferase
LRSELSMMAKIKRLVVAGVLGILLGLLIDALGICPLAKRIWTPSWRIFSAEWVTLMLAGLVAVIDWRGW